MGVHARDYMRDRPLGPDADPADGPAALATWAVTMAVAFGSLVLAVGARGEPGRWIAEHLALDPAAAFGRQRFWQVLTGAFFVPPKGWLAAGAALVLFVLVGRRVEAHLGGGRLLVLFFGGTFAASLGALALARLFGPGRLFPGPAGGAFAVAAFAACLSPDRRVGSGPLRGVRLAPALFLGVLLTSALALLAPPPVRAWPAVLGGLGGAVGGALLFVVFGPTPRRRARPPAARAPPLPPEALREQVDALLDRIRADGYESLSPEERAFLRSASKQYAGPGPPP